MLIQSKQDREPLSALALVCLCPAGKLFPNKTRNIFLLPAHNVSARQGPLPGHLAQSRHRTVTPDPGLLNPEYIMEPSRSAGALLHTLLG